MDTEKNPKLTPEFIESIKKNLLEEKTRIETELAGIGQKEEGGNGKFNVNFPNYGDEEEDSVVEVADYETNLSVGKGIEKLLRDIESSLARIEKGTYGTCKYCEKPIDPKRLLARPTSSSCVECKKTINLEV
jgi:RNA polymerase-binding protein DksA